MLKDITLGQYYPCQSPVHSMDARIKILLSVVYMAAVFCIGNVYGYAALILFTAIIIKISGIPLSFR